MPDAYFRGEPLRIGQETQLLIDDTVVEDRWRLTRVMHRPDKWPHNPVVLADKPWESDDGYHREKPLFDHCPFGRWKRTNIVYYGTWDQGPWYGSDDPELKRRRIRVVDKSQPFRDEGDPAPSGATR
jgi:hypothetical protein